MRIRRSFWCITVERSTAIWEKTDCWRKNHPGGSDSSELTDFTGILHLEDYDTDITNIIFSKETLYTLKMEIAQIEGKDFSEETTDPGQDAATDPAADTADTEGDTAAQDAGSDPAASGEDTQDGDTQEDTARGRK